VAPETGGDENNKPIDQWKAPEPTTLDFEPKALPQKWRKESALRP